MYNFYAKENTMESDTPIDAPTSQEDGDTTSDVNGANEANGSDKDESSKKRTRLPKGSVTPAFNLEEASDIIIRIYELAGSDASYDVVGRITSNSPGSSVFARKLITLKNYGLIVDENRTVKLTDTGRQIATPRSSTERALALKQAFLSVPLYARVYDKFKGRLLPPDEFLINTFIEYVPTKELATTWMDGFKKSAKKAGLLETRPDGKITVLETINPAHHEVQAEGIPPSKEDKPELVPPSPPTPPLPTPPALSDSDGAIQQR